MKKVPRESTLLNFQSPTETAHRNCPIRSRNGHKAIWQSNVKSLTGRRAPFDLENSSHFSLEFDLWSCYLRSGFSEHLNLTFYTLTRPNLYRQTSLLIGLKNHELSAWLKHRQLVWPINVGHLSDV